MKPQQAKSEEEVADLIEAWEREEEEIKRQDPEVTMTDPWRMTAIKCILTPKLYDHVELRSGSLMSYEELRREIMTISVHRRLTNTSHRGMTPTGWTRATWERKMEDGTTQQDLPTRGSQWGRNSTWGHKETQQESKENGEEIGKETIGWMWMERQTPTQ